MVPRKRKPNRRFSLPCPVRNPRTVKEWLDHIQASPHVPAESKVVAEVMARYAVRAPGGGFTVEATDEFHAEAAQALRYWRSGGTKTVDG